MLLLVTTWAVARGKLCRGKNYEAKGKWGGVEYSYKNLVIITDVWNAYRSSSCSGAHMLLSLLGGIRRSSLKLGYEEWHKERELCLHGAPSIPPCMALAQPHMLAACYQIIRSVGMSLLCDRRPRPFVAGKPHWLGKSCLCEITRSDSDMVLLECNAGGKVPTLYCCEIQVSHLLAENNWEEGREEQNAGLESIPNKEGNCPTSNRLIYEHICAV